MKPYFVLYIKKRCQWCRKAIDLLNEKKEPYIVTDLTKNKEVFEELKVVFNQNTVPIILYADNDNSSLNLIGGYTELETAFEAMSQQGEQDHTPAKENVK